MSTGEILWEKWTDPFSKMTDDDGEEQETNDSARGSVLVSPQGILPFQENTRINRYYNLWNGHTNFRLNSVDVNRIVKVNGVESLNVPTRHRFRIAIGKSFDEGLVKDNIEKLFHVPPARSPRKFAEILSENLSRKWKFWAVLKHADGRLRSVGSQTLDGYAQQLITLEGKSEVLCSWK